MPTTIAHIIHWPRSGIGTLVKQLIENDRSGKFNYIVVLLETDTESESQFTKLGASAVGVSIRSNKIGSFLKIRKALLNAEIIHIHSFVPQLISFLASPKRKQVRTIHNPYPYFSATDWRSRIKRSTEGLLIRLSSSSLISVSSDIFFFLPWRLSKKTTSVVIENGVAQKLVEKASVAVQKPSGFLFVTLGRLEYQKGFDLLIDAMAILKTKLPNDFPAVNLWIIGEGSCRDSLQLKAKTLCLDNITFVGYQAEPENYLIHGDAFVLPSRFEGFSLAAIEAMSIGLPVILTEIGGIAGRLSHGENAHIIPKENPEELANALLTFLDQPAYRNQLKENGKTFVNATFSIDACVSKHAAVYLETQ